MTTDFAGKTALITGAGRDIGRAAAWAVWAAARPGAGSRSRWLDVHRAPQGASGTPYQPLTAPRVKPWMNLPRKMLYSKATGMATKMAEAISDCQ
jgi:hypothetical protein